MTDLESTFKALADMTRMRIVNLLLYGESCVCELQDILRQSQPKISRHLAYLKNSGLVEDRREATRVFYSLRDELRKSHLELLESLKKTFRLYPILGEDLARLKRKLATEKIHFIQQAPLPAGLKSQGRAGVRKGVPS